MSEQWSSEMRKQWETVIKGIAAKEEKLEHLKELCARAADALNRTLSEDERFEPSMQALIDELRKTAE